eukprot:scaffold27839_cov65-Phaeocystis_antarctica.AAC.1
MRDSDGGTSSASASTPGRCPTLHCCMGCGCRANAAHADSNDTTRATPAIEREPHKTGPAVAADMQARVLRHCAASPAGSPARRSKHARRRQQGAK